MKGAFNIRKFEDTLEVLGNSRKAFSKSFKKSPKNFSAGYQKISKRFGVFGDFQKNLEVLGGFLGRPSFDRHKIMI